MSLEKQWLVKRNQQILELLESLKKTMAEHDKMKSDVAKSIATIQTEYEQNRLLIEGEDDG